MSNTFFISAEKLIASSENLENDLLFLGYFFFNSYYDKLVITDIERFGDSDQILDAMGGVIKAGRYYNRGYYTYEAGVKERDKNRMNQIHSVSSPDHRLVIVIQKPGVTSLGVYSHIGVDIRFLPKKSTTLVPSKDYDVYHKEFNELFHMDKDNSYIVVHGTCHDNTSPGELKKEYNGCYLPNTFSFGGNEGNLTTARLDEYFGYLSLMGSKLKNGVMRFSGIRKFGPTPLFLELSVEALKAGIAETCVVKANKIEFKVNPLHLSRFGIVFAYDEVGFPDGFHITTEETFFVEGRNEASTKTSRNFNYLEAL